MTPATATCPTCGKAIDPLRAPVVRVRVTGIVAYCSSACADGAAAPVTSAAAAVTERTALAPMAPAATGAARAAAAAEAAKAEVVARAASDEPAGAKDAKAPAAKADEAADAKAAKAPAAKPDEAADTKDPKAAKPPAAQPDDAKRAKGKGARPGAAKAAPSAPSAPPDATKPTPPDATKAAPLDATKAAPPDDAKAAPRAVAPFATGPVAAIRERRPSSGSGLVDEPTHPPYDAPYDEPEDEDHDAALRAPLPRRAGRPRSSRRRRVVALSIALVAGGAAIAVLSTLVSPSHPHRVDAAAEHPPPPPRPAPPPPPPPRAAPAEVYAHARAVLTQLLASPSDRVRRVAAIALARVGDKPALDYLGKALDTETSAISRMEDAYALARAGDPRGKTALTSGLVSPRRDVRGDAARDLLLLGDAAGAPFMTDLMGLEQNRLSAAEVLAATGDAKAIAALRAIAADAKASHEAHVRALRALAGAGVVDVAAALRAEIAATPPDPFAAQALGRLGDAAALPLLVAQLDVASNRVDAAVALRRFAGRPDDHKDLVVDPTDWAERLAPQLTAGRDTDQVTACEAALILLGPSTLAEHE